MDRRTFLKIGSLGVLAFAFPGRAVADEIGLTGLLQARVIMENYRAGKITAKDMESAIREIGYKNAKEFWDHNREMCIAEIDRCFEPVMKTDHTQPFICKGCDYQEKNKCCVPESVAKNKPYPVHPGQIYDKQAEALSKKDVIHYANALDCLQWWNFEDHSPPECVGKFIQIEEAMFDFLWGMESLMISNK